MCLITFAYKSHPVYSLILLTNRDEFYDRPSAPMQFWDSQPSILAGQDSMHGGTWLGLNKDGKFAAVTNFRDGFNVKPNAKSRGYLTRDYLKMDLSAVDYIQRIQPVQESFGDYNLLLGDATGLYYHSNRTGSVEKLSSGIYGLSNALLDSPWPKLLKVRHALSEQIEQQHLDIDRLEEIMSDEAAAEDNQLPDTGISYELEKLLSSIFIKSENYGTRVTTLFLQKRNGETTIIERNREPGHYKERQKFCLNVPAIGV